MQITTKIFGEITINQDRVIHFPKGIIGFSDLTDFTLIYNSEKGSNAPIRWLQSLQEPAFAMPVMDPLLVKPDYNPKVSEEYLSCIGELESDDMLVLVTVTIPSQIENLTVNLKAPIVVNTKNLKACQVITEVDEYPVKFPIYSVLQAEKKKAGTK